MSAPKDRPLGTSYTPGAATAPQSCDQVRAGILGRPYAPEPVSAVAGDQRQMRERFDVLDQRRPAIDAALEGPRRHEGRDRSPGVQIVHESALLSRDVCGRDLHQAHLDAVARGSFADRELDRPHCRRGVALDADDHLAGTHRRCGEDRTIENQMGSSSEKHLVLEARGLALGPVGHDDAPPRACLGHGTHLRRDGKSGATTPQEPAALDRRDEFVTFARFGKWRWADGCEMLVEANRAIGPPTGDDPGQGSAVAHPLVPPWPPAESAVAVPVTRPLP